MREIYNHQFHEGMFSSVKAAMDALKMDSLKKATKPFLFLPVDIALIRPATLKALLAFGPPSPGEIRYPTFDGHRGHPPLIDGTWCAAIAVYQGPGGLGGFLARHEIQTMAAIRQNHPQEWSARGDDMAGYRPPDGESFADLPARVVRFFERFVFQEEAPVLIITHAGVIRVLLCQLLGMPLSHLFQFHLDYASLTVLETGRDQPKLKLFNHRLLRKKRVRDSRRLLRGTRYSKKPCFRRSHDIGE